MIAFLDLETTGLRPEQEEILEVACIVTDDQLVEVARFHELVMPTHQFYELDEFVRDMHTKNGLWKDLTTATGISIPIYVGEVDAMLAAFLRANAVKLGPDDKGEIKIERPQLAGNTISFDRAFMRAHMPHAEAELHYRNLDVSSLNEMARRFWPKVWEARPRLAKNAAHRAMADCEDSLRVARYYSTALAPAPSNLPTAEHLP